MLLLLSRTTSTINTGWKYLPVLPSFGRREKHTLQAALLVRSFKSLSPAIDLAVRGYYVSAATLLRSLYENELILWATDVVPDTLSWLWEQEWPRAATFMELARKMDAWLEEHKLAPRMVSTWTGMYGTLSEVAHPRGRRLRMEFDEFGLTLNTGPQWDAEYLLFALGIALLVGLRLILLERDFLSRLGEPSKDWLDAVAKLIADVEAWLMSNPLGDMPG